MKMTTVMEDLKMIRVRMQILIKKINWKNYVKLWRGKMLELRNIMKINHKLNNNLIMDSM